MHKSNLAKKKLNKYKKNTTFGFTFNMSVLNTTFPLLNCQKHDTGIYMESRNIDSTE